MVNQTEKRPEVFLENGIFSLSLVLLAAAIGAFFYVRYEGDRGNIELAGLVAQSTQGKTEEQKDLENKVMLTRQKLDDFSKIMAGRKSAVMFFDKFENLVPDGVYFSKFGLDFSKMSFSLGGHGKSFQDMERQIVEFESAAVFDDVDLKKAAFSDKGSIDFETEIIFNQGMVAAK